MKDLLKALRDYTYSCEKIESIARSMHDFIAGDPDKVEICHYVIGKDILQDLHEYGVNIYA